MELSRKKVIFLSTVGIVICLLLILLLIIMQGGNRRGGSSGGTSNPLTIWMIGQRGENTQPLIQAFKKAYPRYSSKTINIEVFGDAASYNYTLASAISSGKAPDIFVLNNNETSVFADQVRALSSNEININDFRKRYKSIFTKDLITSNEKGNDYLIGIPVGYETLGIFYNKTFGIKSTDVATIPSIKNFISEAKQKYPNIIPLGIGNGSTVKYASDIATQFMMLENGGDSIMQLVSNQIKAGLSAYTSYGYDDSDNRYNTQYADLKNEGKDASYLLAEGDVMMAIGYPRFIYDIDRELNGRNKSRYSNLLFAEPFPHYVPGEGKTFVNYDYFVLNKNAINKNTARDFLKFLSSESGAESFLNTYTYYLPALLSLEDSVKKKRIHSGYNIILGNFTDLNQELSSFNKGIRTLYDEGMVEVLDAGANYSIPFEKFKSRITCIYEKAVRFEGLSRTCQ